MIVFDHVGLIRNKTKILEDISFTVNKGEFVFLTGPSGVGKSSILNLIHLYLFPTAGSVSVQGVDTRRIPRSHIPRLRRSIGYIFQDYKLLRDKTAFENVAFALEVTGTKNKLIKQKTYQALNIVGMSHRLGHYPDDLSGGECQRVAIARAIVREPFILLADEPTGNLDDDNSAAIIDLLEKINHSGTAVLMATHKPLYVAKTQAKIVSIDRGRVV